VFISIEAGSEPASATALAIRADGVRQAYGDVVALDGVDLEIPTGTVFGLLGPNGAGKTTLVRILSTLLHPTAGRASVLGFDVVAEPLAVRRRLGLAGQFAAVDEELTGRENVELIGRLYRLPARSARARAGELLERLGLADVADRRVSTYSGGMRRRLDLGATLVGRPPVILLDEPRAAGDCRAARPTGWRSRGRSSSARRCCSSTSRPRISTPAASRGSSTSSAGSPGTPRPSSPATRRRCSRPAIA
jgi:ABC-type transporter Mla maintaining outer membrane lipid asymmetry ATPase subunit MlaF